MAKRPKVVPRTNNIIAPTSGLYKRDQRYVIKRWLWYSSVGGVGGGGDGVGKGVFWGLINITYGSDK